MDVTPMREEFKLNSDAPWDSFDSMAYLSHNYRTLRSDDRQILSLVRDHFGAHFAGRPAGSPLHGIDVGAGTNLYPSLAMLPWCGAVTLFERAEGNVAWLHREVRDYGGNWDEFWAVLREGAAYRAVEDPRARLAGAATVVKGDLFADLPERRCGIGTMFFVAESMSSAHEEFESAVDRFAGALLPGAPFAVAFMENSLGYDVGDLRFPACQVGADDVLASLRAHAADDLRVSRIEIPGEPLLRDGYTGMLLALGRLRP